MIRVYLFLFVFVPFVLFAEVPGIPSSVEKVTTFLLKQEYGSAREFVKKNSPSKIDSLFLSVLISNAEIVDYESYAVQGKRFLMLCDSARITIQKTPEYKRPLVHHYYLGIIEGCVAVVRGKRSDFAGSLTASNVSKKYLQMVNDKDSTFAPALFGLALRDFYSASVTSKVGLGKSKIAAAIRTMNNVTEGKTAVTQSFEPSLFWVYIDNHNYELAEQCAEGFLRNYPGNTVMMRGLAKVLTVQKKYDESEKVAHELMKISEHRVPVNWSDYYSGGVAVVTALVNMNRHQEASKEAARLLAIKNDTNTMKLEWVKKHRKKLLELKAAADSKM